MIRYIAVLALSVFFANVAGAHAGVVIENADKVIIKQGMSHMEKMRKLECLVMLKEHNKMEDAMAATMEKIDAKCTMHGMNMEKCRHFKMKVAKGIHHCYTAEKFFKYYFGMEK